MTPTSSPQERAGRAPNLSTAPASSDAMATPPSASNRPLRTTFTPWRWPAFVRARLVAASSGVRP